MDPVERMLQATAAFERELKRYHPETITPREWIAIRAMVLQMLESNRDAAHAMRELSELARHTMDRVQKMEAQQQWQPPSETSLFGLILNRLRRR